MFMDLPEFNFDASSFEMPVDFNAGSTFMDFIPQYPLPPFPEDYPSPETTISTSASTQVYTHEDYDHIEDICVCLIQEPRVDSGHGAKSSRKNSE